MWKKVIAIATGRPWRFQGNRTRNALRCAGANSGDVMTLALDSWRDFYVMVGTASGAIVGATFVVATLASGMEKRTLGMRGFITPTAVHLGSVVVVSALLCVPALSPLMLAIFLGAGAIAGAVYAIVVLTRLWPLTLGIDDWLFYGFLPLGCYGVLAAAAFFAFSLNAMCLDLLAGALIVLLMVGMRNAWDMATFMVMGGPSNSNNAPPPAA